MTPESFAVALLLTYLAATIIDRIFAPVQFRRAIVVALLLLSLIWVYGAPFVIVSARH